MAALNQVGVQNALSVTGTATALTVSTRLPTHAIIQVAGADIRWRADGTAPTASVGLLVTAGSNIEFMDPTVNYESIIKQFQAIRTGSVSATLEVAYFAI